VEEEERNKTETAEAGKTKKPKNPAEGKKTLRHVCARGFFFLPFDSTLPVTPTV
jgi:hypothetical protein